MQSIPTSFPRHAAILIPILGMVLACAGLDLGEALPDPGLPVASVSNPEFEATITAQTVEATPETTVLEVRLASLDDTTAAGVLYTKDGDGWCRSRNFEATKNEEAWESRTSGKPKVRTCPATQTARDAAPGSAMDGVQGAVPADYQAKNRDPELESAICQAFNTLDWEETFFGASMYQPWKEKHAGSSVSRSGPAWLFAVSPDGRCRRQDFTVQQEMRSDGTYGAPHRLSTGAYDDMRCPDVGVVQAGLLACMPSKKP